MRILGGQVHLAEIALLAVMSFLCFLIGFSLPLMALILMVTWPLLLIQMVFEGAILWLLSLFRRHRASAGPARPPRTGLARYIWLAPLIALTVGYAGHVISTGKWFL